MFDRGLLVEGYRGVDVFGISHRMPCDGKT